MTLHHVVFSEQVAPPSLPWTSPLHRSLLPAPEGGITGEFLRTEPGTDAAVPHIEALERGEGPSGADVALIEWRLAWGEGGDRGTARFWGVCALPCTIEDSFVATREHHPADPVSNPRVLFAGRPGAVGPVLSRSGQGIEVRHGDERLWPVAAAGGAIEAEATVDVPLLEADGVSQETTAWAQHRRLEVTSAESRPIELSARAEGPPGAVRVLPDLPARPHNTRRRGVEGITEVWPWFDATIFEGGFSVKPDPAASGLQFQRHEQRVLWKPTARQADQREASFVTYTLKRPSGMTATVEPFPLGVDVLASLPALDDRFRIAFAADPNLQGRARQIQSKLEGWHKTLPLPAMEHTQVVYVMQEATTLVPGSAGEAALGFSVDDDWSEVGSVRRAFVRMTLGANAGLTTAAIDDWLLYVAGLLGQAEDRSWLAHTFASAGDDVAGVWREWLQDPARGGDLSAEDFLEFVNGQLPALAWDLRDRLVMRSFALDLEPEGQPWTPPEEVAEEDQPSAEDLAEAAAEPEATPQEAADPAPPATPPAVAWKGEAAVHGTWRWLPWPEGLQKSGWSLRVDARPETPVSWVVAPLSAEQLATLGTDDSIRSKLATALQPRRGPTADEALLPLPMDGQDGILVGVWGTGTWAAGFAVVETPAAPDSGG